MSKVKEFQMKKFRPGRFVTIHTLTWRSLNCGVSDDLGQPKHAMYGDHNVALNSTQSQKYMLKKSPVFRSITEDDGYAVRTRYVTEWLKLYFIASGKAKTTSANVAKATFEAMFGEKKKAKDDEAVVVAEDEEGDEEVEEVSTDDDSEVLRSKLAVFLTELHLEALGDHVLANWDEFSALVPKPAKKGEVKEDKKPKISQKLLNSTVTALKGVTPSLVIAAFGNMFGKTPELSHTAALCVSPAISTHSTEVISDFFSSVEDLNQDAGLGASIIGNQWLTCGCQYGSAMLDLNQDYDNLNGDVEKMIKQIRGIMWAFSTLKMPGKRSSTNEASMPSLILVEIHDGSEPLGLHPAFVSGIKDPKRGIMQDSIDRLESEWSSLKDAYEGLPGKTKTFVIARGYELNALEACRKDKVSEVIEDVVSQVKQMFSKGAE